MLGEPVVVRSGAPGYGVPRSGAAPVRPPLVGEGKSAGGGGVHHAAVRHVPGGQALLSAGVWSCIQHCFSLMDFLEKKLKKPMHSSVQFPISRVLNRGSFFTEHFAFSSSSKRVQSKEEGSALVKQHETITFLDVLQNMYGSPVNGSDEPPQRKASQANKK